MAEQPTAHHPHRPHAHALREAVTMALYLAIVLLSLMVGFGGEGDWQSEVSLIWGTAIGLGIAHLFAFWVTAVLAEGTKPETEDWWAALGIAGSVVFIAAVASLPYLIWGDTLDASTVSSLLLMGIIGITAFESARFAGVRMGRSIAYTAVVLLIAAVVVALKFMLAH